MKKLFLDFGLGIRQQIAFRIPDSLDLSIANRADHLGLSKNAYLRQLVERDLESGIDAQIILAGDVASRIREKAAALNVHFTKYLERLLEADLGQSAEQAALTGEERKWVLDLYRSIGEEYTPKLPLGFQEEVDKRLAFDAEEIARLFDKLGLSEEFDKTDLYRSLFKLVKRVRQVPLPSLGRRTIEQIIDAYTDLSRENERHPTVHEFSSALGLSLRQFQNLYPRMVAETGEPLTVISQKGAERLDRIKQVEELKAEREEREAEEKKRV